MIATEKRKLKPLPLLIKRALFLLNTVKTLEKSVKIAEKRRNIISKASCFFVLTLGLKACLYLMSKSFYFMLTK